MRILLAAALLAGGTQVATAQSIGGHYTVQGATSSGGMYAGVAQILFNAVKHAASLGTPGAPP